MADWLLDPFTEASTTLLQAHTPTIGTAWVRRAVSSGGTERDGQIVGGSGVVTVIGGSVCYTNNASPAGTNYYVEAVWSNSSASFFSMLFNFTGSGTWYEAQINYYDNNLYLAENNGWSGAGLAGPFAISRGAHTIRAELTVEGGGKRIKVFFDGIERFNLVDPSPLSGVGNVGFFMDGGELTSIVAGGIGGPATEITFTGPSSGTVGSPSTNFTVGANGDITGTITVTPNDGGDGGTFTPTSVNISSASPTAAFTYTPANAGSPTATINVTNNGGLSNPSGIAFSATVPPATTMTIALKLSDGTTPAASITGIRGAIFNASTLDAATGLLDTFSGESTDASGNLVLDIAGLGLTPGQVRQVGLNTSDGTVGANFDGWIGPATAA